MKTGGYDVLIEINERLINHALTAAFYSSYYSAFEGTIVPRTTMPLGDMIKVDYRIELAEPPFIDFLPPDQMKVRLSLIAFFKIIGRKVRTDLAVDVLGKMSLDPASKEVSMEVLDIRLGELRLLDRFELPKVAKAAVNEALVMAIRSSLIQSTERGKGLREISIPITAAPQNVHFGDEIKISLLPGFPGITIKMPSIEVEVSSLVPASRMDIGEVDMPVFPSYFGVISDHSMALAITIAENVVGDPAGIKDFTDGSDLAIGFSEASLNRMLDRLWSQMPRDIKVAGEVPVENVRELLDTMRGIRDVPSRFETLGLTRKDTEVEKAWVDFTAIINPDKPKFRLTKNGKFEIYDTRALAKAQATVMADEVTTMQKGRNAFFSGWMKPKEQAPPEVQKAEVELYRFDSEIDVLLKRMVVDLITEDGSLKFDVSDIDFSLDIPWRLPKFVLEGITNRIEQSIRKNFPAVDLTEMIHDRIGAMVPFAPRLKIGRVIVDDAEALIVANMDFKGTPGRVVPVPSFVADPRTESREVHRASCPSVRRIPEGSQVGYTSLYDALADGLKGAKDCLPGFEQGLAGKGSTVKLPEVDIPLFPAREKTVTHEEVLIPIPITNGEEMKRIVVVDSSDEAPDRTSHEVKGK